MPALKASLLCAAGLGLVFAHPALAQSPDPSNLPRFDSVWQEAIKPNAGFWSPGVAQEFAYTAGPSGVTSVGPPSANLIANVRQIYGSQAALTTMTYLEIIDGLRNVTFVRANADTFTPIAGDRATYARASDWTRHAVVADPLTLGWQYQSFAAWQTGLGQPTGSMGAASFGLETPWNGTTAVPQSGQATFNGFMGGVYNDAVGQGYAVTADVGIQMNFQAHTADFATTNTQDRDGARDDLNISGAFVGLPNFPQMFGSLTTARLKGDSSGRFFGPAAEEFGGVFTLTPKSGEGLERLAGAFGSRRGAPVASTRFTNWSDALKPGATIVLLATAGGFLSPSGSFTDAGATVTETLDGTGALASLQVTSSSPVIPGLSFSTAAGDTLGALAPDRRFVAAAKPGQTQTALIADPVQMEWNYQSFGAWQTTAVDGGVSRVYPAGVSAGAETPATALPPSGEVTFRGVAAATYVRSANDSAFVIADVAVDTNFANRTAAFRSENLVNVGSGVVYGGTALSAALSWNATNGRLGGAVKTADGRMSGGIDARFYGPAAQEIGGAFALGVSASSPERIAGAFGAKR